MKSYREIADNVFARRDAYVAQQRKKKRLITRAAASVGSVALVSLAGFALFKSDVFRDTPPVTDGGATATTTTTASATEASTAPTTSASATTHTTVTTETTHSGNTQTTTTITVPVKTEPSTTAPTTTTTVPKKQVVGGNAPDDFCIDSGDESSLYVKPISPLLQATMEQHKDEDVVYAVLVAIRYPVRYPTATLPDPQYDPVYYAAYQEFLKTDRMAPLVEQIQIAYAEYIEAENALPDTEPYPEDLLKDYKKKKERYGDLYRELSRRSHAFYEDFHTEFSEQSLQMLTELSEIEPCNLNRVNPEIPIQSYFDNQYHYAVAVYSWRAGYAYSAVLSADAIRELAAQGRYAFWLDSPDTDQEIDWRAIMDSG